MQYRRLHNTNQAPRRGLTLVELLVVIAIMVLLLAVSVPIFRPMLETRKTSDAAQVLAGAFQQARMKSIQEGRSYGIKLVPFETAPTTVIQLRLQKDAITHNDVNPHDTRVVIEEGVIIPYVWDDETGWRRDPQNSILEQFRSGRRIQFNRIGRWFTIGDNHRLAKPYNELYLPDLPTIDPMEYLLSALPVPTWQPQMVMPRGTIVDLSFSGGETVNVEGEDKGPVGPGNIDPEGVPPHFWSGANVIVQFSPAGYVDALYIDGVQIKGNEMLYFCVGDWDRQVDASGVSLADDGRSNLEAPATRWVTIHPRTGEIRIAENAPIQSGSNTLLKRLRDARKFASEHFFNVGGF